MNRIDNYIKLITPENISKKKKKLIRDEMLCHIYDRVDFYKDAGYSQEESITKALEDMGNDDSVKLSIKNSFAELHAERIWWAIIAFFISPAINFIALFCGVWVTSFDSKGKPLAYETAISFAMLFTVFALAVFCHKKGFRKCLAAIGVSNFIIGVGSLLCFYPQPAVYSLAVNVGYLLDEYTPVVMRGFDFEILSFFLSIALMICFAIWCFVSSHRIRVKGKPPKKLIQTAVIAIIFCLISVVSVATYESSQWLFIDYPQWFRERTDALTNEGKEIYGKIETGKSYDEALQIVKEYGYVTVDEFAEPLDRADKKRFRYNFEQMNFIFDEDYEIYFDPNSAPYRPDYSTTESNNFIFLLKDENGVLISKGAGCAFGLYDNYGGACHYSVRSDDIDAVAKRFKSLKKGDSESDALTFFGKENGEMFTCFETDTPNGQKTYYRFYSRGADTAELPGSYDNWNGDCEVYIELEFIDGLLNSGKLNYVSYEKNKFGNEVIEVAQ